ncbi:MarR family winged helix-turn-helix transcriptional regulator [Megasphaera hominis]|jgi:DNA-binding MarR family transcriptional regulator|uniref:Winged helix DNA-binding protein n=1 Tax=Megasphaera hominis TaxID=159836 RepID=A0ABR6VJF2_9FIRM|nr:winged helix DNA-binding protein [Megasphaera hominis]MBC3537407.1 winged helix DNA-binding protein [Megasphaera hominis]
MNPPFQELSYATRRMIVADKEALKEFGFTYSQWTFMVYVAHNQPTTLVAIARYYMINNSAITTIKKKFLDKGYIEEVTGTDQREKKVSLTPSGEREYYRINQKIREMEKKFFHALSTKELAQLQEMLYRINTEGFTP